MVWVDLGKEPLSDPEITRLMLGPTGNLRAPTLLADDLLVVGFPEEVYLSLMD